VVSASNEVVSVTLSYFEENRVPIRLLIRTNVIVLLTKVGRVESIEITGIDGITLWVVNQAGNEMKMQLSSPITIIWRINLLLYK
tara:strand:+ start:2700 stop:2954 length:255 start_codon:yes stop_codon:yes gene_type:complete